MQQGESGGTAEPSDNGGAEVKGSERKWIALGLLLAIAGLAWETIDPGKIRSVVLLLLLLFAVRVLLAAASSSR
jgi:hypothetical protein